MRDGIKMEARIEVQPKSTSIFKDMAGELITRMRNEHNNYMRNK
jgi:hypothetical protein